MKKTPREISLGIVGRVLNRGAFSNVLLARTLEDPSLKPEQKRRINALTLGTLRNCILLERLLDESAERKWKVRPVVRTAGLLGAFE
ncbi:MAG: transcription antitermination factor NusB, partial [bacterium]